ncbi:hypothetical protein CCR87_14140 [Rhodobaculum claviforme]|uniref:MotA/TolQ/ExbB proton channel domain-containing protein n=2 Tax=Rhodobaculum claviforme TaxID=1549854 RepID=A0A934WKD8_9RHOB|nr:hypothetical protein [Rhodobaculum claviforme]
MWMDFGDITVAFIVWFAGVLVSEGAPGWVAISLASGFIVALLSLDGVTRRQTSALALLKESLAKAGSSNEFATQVPEIDATLSQARKRGAEYEAIATAWSEYRETHIIDDMDGAPVIRNAVRPSVFFNVEDLGFGPGWLRILPNMFVTVGLFLTFLGLIAALTQFQERIGPSGTLAPEEMAGFLGIASAKFIMSLTGLAGSILFTLALRRSVSRVEIALRQANEAIEDRLSFLSQEDIALRMLKEQSQTRTMLQGLATDIATQINQSLSGSIGGAIRDGLAPLIERVQAQSSEGVGALVETLSDRLSGDVGRALSEASGRLDLAAERLMEVVDRLAQSGAATGSELKTAGEALATALGGLEEQIAAAGTRAEAAVAAEAEATLSGARDRLLSPFDALATHIRAAADATQAASEGLREVAKGAQTGGAAARAAAEGFGQAARDFTAAARPVAEAAGRIEDSNKAVEAAAGRLAQTAAESAKAAQAALSAAQTTLAAKTQAVEAVLTRLREITDRLQGQGEEMDKIDQMLGKALDRYTAEVQAALDQLQKHVQSLQKGLEPALDTLREVVEQAEAFRPTPPGGRR